MHRVATPTSGPRVTRLGLGDLAAMVELQALVTAQVPNGFVRAKGEPALRQLLAGAGGAAFGIVDRGRLLAMSLLSLPHASIRPGGVPFPLVPDADWPSGVAFLENTMVHPAARGRGLQLALVAARSDLARALGRHWLCAGVHLGNRVSWTNLLRAGLAIVGIRDDLGYPVLGLLRGLNSAEWNATDDVVRVAVSDEPGHRVALSDRRIGLLSADGGHVDYRRLLLTGGRPGAGQR